MKTYKADTKNYISKKTGSVTFEAQDWEAARLEACRLMKEWNKNEKYTIEQIRELTDIETGETFTDYLRKQQEA